MNELVSNKIFTVSELTYAIKSILENNFRYISIQGEISNIKFQSSGHIYFSLKDSNAQISAALFKGSAKNLTQMPKDGDQVIIDGELSVYPPRGNYQIIVRKLRLVGIGELLLKLHELKQRLKNKGYFDKEHKKKLPMLPKRIGIVTSPTGAVIQDVLNVLKRRFSNFHLILNPIKVQGEGAKEEIAQAIYDFNKYNLADVLIIGRGGGSIEDLMAFNEEIVAEAIFASDIPIISAVGHETDVSIADLVADIRAPTPSAAAEIVIQEKEQIIKTLKSFHIQIAKNTYHLFQKNKIKLKNYESHPLLATSDKLIANKIQSLDEIKNSLDSAIKYKLEKNKAIILMLSKQMKSISPLNRIKTATDKLNYFSNRFDEAIKNLLNTRKERLNKLISHLKSLDPKNLLKKGYSILFLEKDASIILSTKNVTKDDRILAQLHDGKIIAKVEEKK